MKTLRSLSSILFISILCSSFFIVGCGDSEIEGCTNGFAQNYNALATKDCCCEFDAEALVDEIAGSYLFYIKRSGSVANDFQQVITIQKDQENSGKFVIRDFGLLDVYGTFENGAFTIESEIRDLLGCNIKTTGRLTKPDDQLFLELEYKEWKVSASGSSSCEGNDYDSYGKLERT